MNITLGHTSNAPENSATQLAYNKLRALILTGELAPGCKLKIDDLRQVLGVGASPIREALSLLTSDQLVVRQEQRGFRTTETSRENFQEILQLRCNLESMALRQSIENSTDEWTELLVIVHHRMARSQLDKSKNLEKYHKNFHMALIENCRSPLLLRLCDQLYDLNIRYRFLANRSSDYKGRKVDNEHEAILNAVISGEAQQADKLLMSHYQTTGAFLQAHIR
ncbi:MAG: GntR family transcriptional regulator [Paracoccaceae bacterium]|jgi:DNA-binding GntR family transcriptional regulator|tara:strand:+ start:8507 stop:9175 length:669 start_codon:yes stop_codon:yes gene_type:complete